MSHPTHSHPSQNQHTLYECLISQMYTNIYFVAGIYLLIHFLEKYESIDNTKTFLYVTYYPLHKNPYV